MSLTFNTGYGILIDYNDFRSGNMGDHCSANYQVIGGATYYGVAGILIPLGFTPVEQYWCLTPQYAIQEFEAYIDTGISEMANYLIISTNTLIAQLNIQTTAIVSQVGTSGGGAGGFTDADRSMLITVNNRLSNMEATLNSMASSTLTKLNILDTKVTNMQTNMTIDHNSIQAAIVSGGGLTDDGLIAGIGDLLSGAWSWMADLIAEFANQIDSIWDMMGTLIQAVGDAFWEALTSLVDGMTLGLAFMSAELTFAFDNIFSLIRIPLEALGDIFDLFITEFFEWLEGTFTIDIGEIETGAVTLLETFKRLMANFIAETQRN